MDRFERAAAESAAIALINAGNLKGAEARLRIVLAQEPNDARALALLAHCSLAVERKKEGLEQARAAAAVDPDDLLVRRVLSGALIANGKHQEADAVTMSLASDDPEDSHALFKLAIARSARKDPIGAKELFDAAEEHAGDDADALLNVARLRLHQWNYDKAAQLAKRAMLLNPNDSECFRILGECALACGAPVEAYELGMEALRLSPQDKATFRLLTRARARQYGCLKPFLAGVDWMVEMDRRGLLMLPLLMVAVFGVLAMSVTYDASRIQAGRTPVLAISIVLSAIVIYAVVAYLAAILARIRIWRDLREISLSPKF
jgi:tetratricopeptide (TPR) repeat protein